MFHIGTPMGRSMDFLEAAEIVGGLQSRLGEMGLVARLEYNPTAASDQLNSFYRDTQGDAKINTWLNPDIVMRTERDFFLLTLSDAGGLVGKMSARLDDTHTESFESFALRGLKTVFRDENGEPTKERFPAVSKDLKGRVAYVGDLYAVKRLRKNEEHPLAAIIAALLFVTIHQRWGVPDYTIAWIRPWQSEGAEYRDRWVWYQNAASFSQPACSEFRKYAMGVIDAEMFPKHLDRARSLARISVPGNRCRHRAPGHPVSTTNQGLEHS